MRLKGISELGFQRLARVVAKPSDKMLDLEMQDYEQGLHDERQEKQDAQDAAEWESGRKDREIQKSWDMQEEDAEYHNRDYYDRATWRMQEEEEEEAYQERFEPSENELWREHEDSAINEAYDLKDMSEREPAGIEPIEDESPVPAPTLEDWHKRKRNRLKRQP